MQTIFFLILWAGIAQAFVGLGFYIHGIPAEKLLQWDRKTGYWLYQRELKVSGDEARALAKAATFYKIFAMVLIVIGLLHLLIALTMLIATLL